MFYRCDHDGSGEVSRTSVPIVLCWDASSTDRFSGLIRIRYVRCCFHLSSWFNSLFPSKNMEKLVVTIMSLVVLAHVFWSTRGNFSPGDEIAQIAPRERQVRSSRFGFCFTYRDEQNTYGQWMTMEIVIWITLDDNGVKWCKFHTKAIS